MPEEHKKVEEKKKTSTSIFRIFRAAPSFNLRQSEKWDAGKKKIMASKLSDLFKHWFGKYLLRFYFLLLFTKRISGYAWCIQQRCLINVGLEIEIHHRPPLLLLLLLGNKLGPSLRLFAGLAVKLKHTSKSEYR